MAKQEISINFSSAGLLKIVVFGFLILFLAKIKTLILVILTAVVIASFVDSSSKYLLRFKIPRTFGVLFIYIFLFLFLSGIFYLFVPVLIKEFLMLISSFSDNFPNIVKGSNELFKNISQFSQNINFIDSIQSFSYQVSSGFFSTLVSIFGGIMNFILIFVISFYLSIQEKGIERFLQVITPVKQESYIINLWLRTQKKISQWIRGQIILGLVIGTITFIALSILGIKYALLLSILTAVFELIPFGVLLTLIPAVSVAITDKGFIFGIIVAGVFVLIQQLENYLFQPLILKRSVGIPPIVVIISVVAGAYLAGFWGVILAIPVATAVLEYLSDVEEKKTQPRKIVSG